jgi:hypothetical protein
VLKPAATGIPKGIPVRLASPDAYNPPATRPIVDVETIVAKACNEVITVLAEWRERETKVSKSFLKRKPARPDIDLLSVAESLKESIVETYRVSAAACVPPILDLNDEHQAEIQQLQRKAIEAFCRDMLRVVKGDTELEQQIYEICPALRPAPGPDLKALANLQRRFDEALQDTLEAFRELGECLKYLDKLTDEEVKILAGTSAVGDRRLKTQAEAMRVALARRLEAGTDFDRPVILKVAQW